MREAALLTQQSVATEDLGEAGSRREGVGEAACAAREVAPKAGARCAIPQARVRGEGPGRRREGVEAGALTVGAERGGQGPEAGNSKPRRGSEGCGHPPREGAR